MKERQILFSAPMVLAILEGRKTQTRRAMKFQLSDQASPEIHDGELLWRYPNGTLRVVPYCSGDCPHGKPGDRLYVRETWQHSNYPFGPLERDCVIYYRADYHDDPHGFDGEKSPEGKYRDWKPSIHMPRWASRINLEIIGVRVERLQDISEADALAEGVSPDMDIVWQTGDDTQVGMFGELWESVYGPGSWDENPYVWVIEFRKASSST